MNAYVIPGLKYRRIQHDTANQNFNRVIEIVLDKSGKTEADMRAKCRNRDSVELRQVCMWALKRNTSATLKEIGDRFNRDHTTVIHSLVTVNNLLETKDERVTGIVDRIKLYL